LREATSDEAVGSSDDHGGDALDDVAVAVLGLEPLADLAVALLPFAWWGPLGAWRPLRWKWRSPRLRTT
jgi:hypothetical protein